jgi:hypothetical protein
MFQEFTNMEIQFMLFALPLRTDVEKALENLQNVINMQCDTDPFQIIF